MSRRTRILLLSLAAGATAVAVAIGAAVLVAPRFGVNLVPPSPQDYAQQGVDRMTDAIHASPARVDRVRTEVRRRTADAADYRATYAALNRAAKQLGGRHSRFYSPAEARVSFGREDSGSSAEPVQVSASGGTTTIRVPALGSNDQRVTGRWIRAAARSIDAAAPTTRAWVVDLRGNDGGNLFPMLAVLSPLLDEGTVLSFAYRDRSIPVAIDGRRVLLAGHEQAAAPGAAAHTRRPVAILTDGNTASSAEAVAIAFAGQRDARRFGAPTYGVSTANEARPLYDGARVNITVAVDVDRDGTRYGGPLAPDVPAADAPSAAATWISSPSAN